MKKSVFIIFALLSIAVVLHSCKKDVDKKGDKALFAEIGETGYTYYQNGAILQAKGGSPHGAFKLRFNPTAQSVLDTLGELPTGSTFPNGSILVKDLYTSGNITLHVVMKKDDTDKNNGDGWLWAEYETNGDAVISVGGKGSSCISCHSGSPNRDLTRTFDLH